MELIQQDRLRNIIHMMAEGDLGKTFAVGEFKQRLAPVARPPKTVDLFPFFAFERFHFLNEIRETFALQIFNEFLRIKIGKLKINMHGSEFELDRRDQLPVPQDMRSEEHTSEL